MMRVLFFFALFLFVLSLIDTVSAQCADGSSPFNCLVRPCNANSCKKGIDFCVDDYCGGCNAKCQCDTNSDCNDGQQCQSGFCVAVSTTAAPSSCPSSVETSECVCSHLGKYWAVGGFFDGCNSCQCTEDKRVFCTKKICPIIPTDQPTEEPFPVTSESTSTTAPETTIVAEESSTTASARCADGSNPFTCVARPCENGFSCKKPETCIDDYCGGCNAKCPCDTASDCWWGMECQSGFCAHPPPPTEAPSPCPADSESRECNCFYGGKWYAEGNFWDGCRGCQCSSGQAFCFAVPGCTDPPARQTTTPSTTPSTPINTCLITNHDFSSCENGLTPCAFTTCAAGSQCLTHRCGTENNQCQAICSCGDDSHCASGQICAANEFGIKVCKADTNQECPDGRPGVRCFAAPCSVLSSDRQCKKGADFCLNDYCGGCNANCQCDSNSDCYSDQECKADWKGKKICQATAATTTTRAPTTPAPTTSPSSKVCISNLDCRRGERCDFPFWFSLFGRCVPRTTRPPTTTTPRPAQCEYNGRIFQSGDSFPSADGCNNCFCNENGVIGCTKKACTCPAGQGFVSCKAAPCDMKSCKTGLCTNDYCGGCYAKCRCERDNDCQQGEICQLDQTGWNHCVAKPTTTTTTTTRKPSRTTTSTAPATTACAGKVCPAILCANRAPCKYQCGINYCSCTDYCKCKNNSHCESNERCEIASGETEGKCVNKNRPLLSKLDKF